MKVSRFLACLLVFLAACGGQPAIETPLIASQEPELAVTNSLSEPGWQPATVSPTTSGPTVLHVWVPPQFDPALNTPAGDLLNKRLKEFSKRRPGVLVQMRVKAVDGPGGLLSSLGSASSAAPSIMPDLIALPRNLLEAAVLRGLVYSHADLKPAMQGETWFEYAQKLAQVQEGVYGIPFAGDALTLVYRPSVVPEPPGDWAATLKTKTPLVFPAADPEAHFTLTLYQANGGIVHDDQGRPALDAIRLTEVLTYYMQAERAGVMPALLTQYQSDDQVWDAYQKGRAQMAITWSSRYLGGLSAAEDQAAARLPTADGRPFTLATGWTWALSAREPERQTTALELAKFLTESSFLAQWTEAAGYLPPRPGVLERWVNPNAQALASQVAQSAHLFPANDILGNLATPLWQSTIDVLKTQNDPVSAAQAAASSLSTP